MVKRKYIVSTIVSILLCSGVWGQSRVPDTETFSLQDVVDVVNPTTDDLQDCFDDAVADYFDATYEGSKDRLYNFRNYGTSSNPCDGTVTYSGGEEYPSVKYITLGSSTGTVSFDFDAIDKPDLYLVWFDGDIVIDTGYRGSSNYDYGGSDRDLFTNSLGTLEDPRTEVNYPDTNNPDFAPDGYPYVTSPGSGSTSFTKSTSDTEATVKVYAPMFNTQWDFTMYCPQ